MNDVHEPRTWPARAAFREGLRSAIRGRAVGLVLVSMLLWLPAAAGTLEATTAYRLRLAESAWLDAGGGSFMVTVGNFDPVISSDLCAGLSQRPEVVGSAALGRREGSAFLSIASSVSMGVVVTTPTIWEAIGVDDDARGLILTSSVAGELGLLPGSLVAVDSKESAIAHALPPGPVPVSVVSADRLTPQFTGVLLPSNDHFGAQACLIVARPGFGSALRDVAPSLLLPDGDARTIEIVPTGNFARDFSAEWALRASRWGGLAVGAFVGIMWLTIQWYRRGQFALLSTLGLDAGGRVVYRLSEWLGYAVPATLYGLTLTVLLSEAAGVPRSLAVAHAVPQAGAALVVATALVAAGSVFGTRSLLADLKDR